MEWVFFLNKMNNEIIIDKYGIGHAVVIRDQGKIIDSFIDPPINAKFYPPNTFLKAKILRKVSKLGGYFVKLPNGREGFLRSSKNYQDGKYQSVVSKVFYDSEKAQIFADQLKSTSKYFIIEYAKTGISFSKRIPSSFNKKEIFNILDDFLEKYDDVFVVCRSSIVNLEVVEMLVELEKVLKSFSKALGSLSDGKEYYDGLARDLAFKKFNSKNYLVTEEDGIFEQIGIWDHLEKLSNRKICFNDGSYIIVEQTSAFCAMDVNSGKKLKINSEELNLNVSSEIVRLIKLFGYGGKIIIDFLPCSKQSREKISNKIFYLFADDFAKVSIWGWTKGGVFELERERDKSPMQLLLGNN